MPSRRSPTFQTSLSAIFLYLLLATLWVAGGASRGEVMGQVVVRGVTAALLVGWLILAERPSFKSIHIPLILLAAAIAVPLVQLVPLPPSLWQTLPGRALFEDAATLSGQAQPWRPVAIVPGATANAAASLIVPLATLLFWSGMTSEERLRLPAILLGLVFANAVVGLLQFSSGGIDYPFVNDTLGIVGGTFANRNHFALFMAIGCLLAPVWSVRQDGRFGWRIPVAAAMVAIFVLAVLASGSRAGLLLMLVALIAGFAIAWPRIRPALRRGPRWAAPALIAGLLALLAAIVLASVTAGRALSIARLIENDPGQDMRGRALPVVIDAVQHYLPVGTGMGSFDTIFRIHEPMGLLKATYFNHAHNDFLEIVLDAGVAGGLLLLAGLGWWLIASIKAWRSRSGSDRSVARTGSAVLLLVFLASASDYPARTPLIMGVVMLAALWLAGGAQGGSSKRLEARR